MKFSRILGAMMATLCLTQLAWAQTASNTDGLKTSLSQAFGIPIDSVQETPYGGLYEIISDGEILYGDAKGSFVIAGNLFDVKTQENVTEKRLTQLQQVDFKTLPLEHALKFVQGTGARQIATFEDPNCRYCRMLQAELKKIPDITVYTFMVPVLGADSRKKVENIWCAKDREATWDAWMSEPRVTPPSVPNCTSPTAKVMELSRKIKLSGTPVILFANGERMNGFVDADRIKKTLAK